MELTVSVSTVIFCDSGSMPAFVVNLLRDRLDETLGLGVVSGSLLFPDPTFFVGLVFVDAVPFGAPLKDPSES
jgi:hypothetical protein